MKTVPGLLAIAMALYATEAAACTLFEPPPAEGETIEQSMWRREAAWQRHLRQTVSHVYVARIVRTGRNLRFDPVAVIEGRRPPRWVFVPTNGTCDAPPQLGELRVVFAEHLDHEEFPGQPWNWGRLGVAHSVRLDQVADPGLVAALATQGIRR